MENPPGTVFLACYARLTEENAPVRFYKSCRRAVTGLQTLKPMRIHSPIARGAIALCCTFAAAAVLGQTTYTWTNAAGGDLAGPTNWTPNGVPNPDDPSSTTPGAGDQILFNGNTPGPLTNVCQTSALFGSSGSTVGLYVHLTASQASPVTFISSNGLGGEFRVQSITNEAGAGGLTIGDNGSGNTYNTTWGGINGQVHELRNDSVNPCTLNSGLRIRFGGGGTHTFTFDGSGDWNVTNDMNNNSASISQVTKNGTGTMVWYSTNNPNLGNNGTFGTGNGVSVNGGKLILKTSDSFRSVNIGRTGIIDNASLEYDDVNPAGGGTLSGTISGSGVLQVSSGALTLSGSNTYNGLTTVSNGMLFINSNNIAAATLVYGGTLGGSGTLSGPVTIAPGAGLAPGATNSLIGTLTISNDLTIGGDVAVEVNKSLAQPNDFVVVSGMLTNTGTGMLTVSNLGPAIVAGDKFTLFSKPLQNGAALIVTGASVTWINNLAVDGSIMAPLPPPPVMTFSQSGNSLQISWAGSFKLQSQTNSINGANWADYPGGGTSPVTITVDPSNGSVFFRLISAP